MGKNKRAMIIPVMMIVLLAACGNNGQPAAFSEQPKDGSPSESISDRANSEPLSYAKLYQTSVFLGDSITEGLSYHDVLEEENILAGSGGG